MERIIYISGKITGLPTDEVKAKFQAAEDMLRGIGFKSVQNPCKFGISDNSDWESAMRVCLQVLIQCTDIYMLEDWAESKGAKLELIRAVDAEITPHFFFNHRSLYQVIDMQNSPHIRSVFEFRTPMFDSRTKMSLNAQSAESVLLSLGKKMIDLTESATEILSQQGDEIKPNDHFITASARMIIAVNQIAQFIENAGYANRLIAVITELSAREAMLASSFQESIKDM